MTGNTTNTWTRTRPEIPENKELTNEPNKPITKTYANRKVYSSFRDNTSEVDLPDVQLRNKYNKGVKFLLEVLIFTADILGLFKKGVAISNEFQKFVDNSRHKPNIYIYIYIYIYQGSQFFTKSLKSWLHGNCIKMNSTHKK